MASPLVTSLSRAFATAPAPALFEVPSVFAASMALHTSDTLNGSSGDRVRTARTAARSSPFGPARLLRLAVGARRPLLSVLRRLGRGACGSEACQTSTPVSTGVASSLPDRVSGTGSALVSSPDGSPACGASAGFALPLVLVRVVRSSASCRW